MKNKNGIFYFCKYFILMMGIWNMKKILMNNLIIVIINNLEKNDKYFLLLPY